MDVDVGEGVEGSGHPHVIIGEQYVCGIFNDAFTIINSLYVGSNINICTARDDRTDHLYTFKRVSITGNEPDERTLLGTARDVKYLRRLDSPYIISYIHSWYECPNIEIIQLQYSLYTLKTLAQFKSTVFKRDSSDNYDPVDYFISCKLLEELLNGLDYMHQLNIVHRNLNPDNILVAIDDTKCFLKIANFDYAQGIGDDDPDIITAINPYLAPEVARDRKFSTLADIYSLSLICELDLFDVEFYDSSDIAFSSTGMRDEIIQSLFNVLISAQTSPDWHQRLNAQEILELRDQFMLHPDEIIDNYIARFIILNDMEEFTFWHIFLNRKLFNN